MTTILEGSRGPLPAAKADRFGLSDGDIAELFASNRLLGYFRHDLASGHLYFSDQACAICGIEPTTAPVNLVEVLGRIHERDIDLMLMTLEEKARHGKDAHCVFRVADGTGGYRFVRIVWRHRDNGAPAGELAGIVHVFLDRMPGVKFECGDERIAE